MKEIGNKFRLLHLIANNPTLPEESFHSQDIYSPFPTVFSKDLFGRHVKHRACLGKG